MGSTGPGWRCPWCGRTDTSERPVNGYACDSIGYPICTTHVRSGSDSCLDKLDRGLTRNGVRAGGLFLILDKSTHHRRIHDVKKDWYLELCDFIYGIQEEPRERRLLYKWTRLGCWHEYYVDAHGSGDGNHTLG